MSIIHCLPFYIIMDDGSAWCTVACPGGTSSTYYGKHDAVVQKMADKIAALERCVKAADALIERYGAPANLHAEGSEYHALRSEYDAARAEVDK